MLVWVSRDGLFSLHFIFALKCVNSGLASLDMACMRQSGCMFTNERIRLVRSYLEVKIPRRCSEIMLARNSISATSMQRESNQSQC